MFKDFIRSSFLLYNQTDKMLSPNNSEQNKAFCEEFPDKCLECDNFSSEGNKNIPACLEGQIPQLCVQSSNSRFFPRGGRKESL